MTALPSAQASGHHRASVLRATDITHGYGDLRVLDDLSMSIAPGRRLGLVGDNGSGKSTLLRVLAGVEQPDTGVVDRPDDTAMLEQDLDHDEATTIGGVVEAALAELRDAARRVQELSALVQRLPDDRSLARDYGDALEWAHLREAWDADHRVDRVLRGLGLAHMPRWRRIAELSGGERARVAMAALLVRQPRALLLDEPTNHLDDDGVAFLERHLVRLPGVVVVASHDRAFLDAVASELLDLDPARGGPVRFGGSFSDYLVHRRRERERWERAWRDQQRELAALRDGAERAGERMGHGRAPRDNDKLVHHFRGSRVQKGTARRRRAMLGRVEQLERAAIPQPPEPLRFRARVGTDAAGAEPLLRAHRVQVTGHLAPVSLRLDPGARLLVTGANGAGKSTLLAVLAGHVEPSAGSLAHRDDLRIGLLPQDPSFGAGLESARMAYGEVARRVGGDAPSLVELRLLRERDLDRPLSQLSEGQRRRVALAMLIAWSPELLLLDEPTNHLSPALVSELEDALLGAPCAIVVASHDRWLRSRWPGPELHLEPSSG